MRLELVSDGDVPRRQKLSETLNDVNDLDDETGMLVILKKNGTITVRRDPDYISREEAGRALIACGRSLAAGHERSVIDTDQIDNNEGCDRC